MKTTSIITATMLGLCSLSAFAAAPETDPLTPAEILSLLGAKGRDAGTRTKVAGYHQHFVRIDIDQDGRASHDEYVIKGSYLNPKSREGIFRASDSNRDGFVSREEYVVNRRITDEAKVIMEGTDTNGDRRVTRDEFVSSGLIKDTAIAGTIFDLLDTDKNGSTFTPEYLRVWGRWARAVPAKEVTLGNDGKAQTGPPRTGGRPPSGGYGGRPPSGGFRGGSPGGVSKGGPPDLTMLFDRFDRDKDGRIEKSEAPEFLWSRISTADMNKDGGVTLKEMEAHRSNLRGRPGPQRKE